MYISWIKTKGEEIVDKHLRNQMPSKPCTGPKFYHKLTGSLKNCQHARTQHCSENYMHARTQHGRRRLGHEASIFIYLFIIIFV